MPRLQAKRILFIPSSPSPSLPHSSSSSTYIVVIKGVVTRNKDTGGGGGGGERAEKKLRGYYLVDTALKLPVATVEI